jgi:cytochrome P450
MSVPHFRRLLSFVIALFIVTEIVAFTGVAPHLQPLALHKICGNILFAIGFGCPLVLYLSSLPRLRELGVTAAAALILTGILGLLYQEIAAPQVIAGLGLASLGTLVLRAWRSTGTSRTDALVFLLPAAASLVFTLEVGIFFQLNSAIAPYTCDSYAYVADGALGVQLSFLVGRLFAALPLLGAVCSAIYLAPPPGLVFVFALQARARRPPPVDIVTALLFLGLTGYSLYFLCPVSGPLFAFGGGFPTSPPPVREFVGSRMFVPFTLSDGRPVPRDGMPSLHMASVLIAFWHARPFGRWARIITAGFVAGTFLATMGRGEHYFVDLVVAFPFTLAVHAALTPAWPQIRRPRRHAFFAGAGLLTLWYVLLFFGTSVLLRSPILAWSITAGTVICVVALEKRLFRATMMLDEKRAPAVRQTKKAPGPPGHFLVGNLFEFRRDVLQLLLESRQRYGDVVRFRLGPMIIHLVSHPDHIKHVLVTHQHNYNKATRSAAKIRSVTGEGLLTSNGEAWLRQRRLMQPAFQAQRLAAFTDVMAETTAAMLNCWRPSAERGASIDVASEMMQLTCTIVSKALFGADVVKDLGTLEQAATVVMEHTYDRLESLLDLPPFVPAPRNRRFRSALRQIHQLVDRIISERKRTRQKVPDLLSLLLRERDEDTGQGMSEQQVRNEAITLLLAGHETTANALTWTWFLLSQHPSAADRIRAEAAEVLDDRAPAFSDLPRLGHTLRVFQEALRLYPPIWIMERRVLADDEIGGYHIPRGSTIVLSPYVTHRHPDFWDSPQEFHPDRFLPEPSAGRVPYAYFPFGGGQRLCIGDKLALMEAQVIIPMVLRMFDLEMVPGVLVLPKPGITLRTSQGLPMKLRVRGRLKRGQTGQPP